MSLFFSEWGLGNLAVDSGQLWVSNNREGTEAMAGDVVEGVPIGLGHDNATCLSGAV